MERSQNTLWALRRGWATPGQGSAHGLHMMTSEALTSPCVAVVRVQGDGSSCVQALARRAYMGIEAYHKARTIATGVIACALAVR
jgi:hypothetical protein